MEQQSSEPVAKPVEAQKPHNRKLMGVLAYLGILVIIPFLLAKDDPFVKFHIKQGLILAIIEIALWVLGGMFLFQLWPLINLINLGTLVLAIIGIVNVVNDREQVLPLVGSLAKHFTF